MRALVERTCVLLEPVEKCSGVSGCFPVRRASPHQYLGEPYIHRSVTRCVHLAPQRNYEDSTLKRSSIMGHTTVVQKGSEYRICQKTKRKRNQEHFTPESNNCLTTSVGILIIQGLCLCVNLLLNNLLNIRWIQVRIALPFAFLLSFDRAGATSLFVPLSYVP